MNISDTYHQKDLLTIRMDSNAEPINQIATIYAGALGADNPLTAEQREVLKGLRLANNNIQNSPNKLLFCERAKIARLNKLLRADSEIFLLGLNTILTHTNVDTLLCFDELFKHMLYQRYQKLHYVPAAYNLDLKLGLDSKVKCNVA